MSTEVIGAAVKEFGAPNDLANQFQRNLLANIAYFFVNIIIGILLVPYFVSNLGVAAYGLIPLATSITGYVAIVVQSLNTAVSRFLTMDIQTEDYAAANRTFNTAFFGLTAIILLMIPILFAISRFIPYIFHIPAGQENSATLLFLGVCGAFLIRSWAGNFTVQLFAYNRLDLQNFINIINLVAQIMLIIFLFDLFRPDLALVGIAYMIGAFFASIVSIALARLVCPHLCISISSFDRTKAKQLCGMGSWIVVNQIGVVLFLSIDLIAVNLLFGATSAGKYAIALQWANLLRAISGVLSGVLIPIILTLYARGRTESIIQVTKSAVKLMGLAMALPIGLICGFSTQLLTIWVGADFAYLSPLIILLTAHLVVNLAVLPIFSINVAYDRVRVPGVVTLVMGLANIVLVVALSLLTDWGYYSVAIAGLIVLTMKNALFTPWYATKVLGVSGRTFSQLMLPGIFAAIFLGIMAKAFGIFFSLYALIPLIAAASVATFLYIIFVWKLGLSTFERNIFRACVSNIFSRVKIQ